MAEYSSAIALALRLIRKKGRADGEIIRTSSPATPAQTPWKPGVPTKTALAENLSVVVLDAKTMLAFSRKGEAVIASLAPEATAIAFLAAASLDVPPAIGDLLETGGRRYSVLDVEDLCPGEQTILYTLHLKAS